MKTTHKEKVKIAKKLLTPLEKKLGTPKFLIACEIKGKIGAIMLEDLLDATLQSFIEAEIVRLEGLKVETTDKTFRIMPEKYWRQTGKNEALQDQISHLKGIISNIKEMKEEIWIITDTHFGHDNIVKYCNRPENHNELMMENLKVIKTGDTLIHLGDFCIGKDKEWHEKFNNILNGVKKILILGNHDKQSKNWYLRNGWDFVCEQFSNNYYGKYITFSHIPIMGVQNINIHGHYHNNLPRLLEKKYVVEGEKERNDKDFPLEKYNPRLHKLLCIEDENYKPVLLQNFINY